MLQEEKSNSHYAAFPPSDFTTHPMAWPGPVGIDLMFPPISRLCQGGEAEQCTSNEHLILLSFMQDVDTAFLKKSDLETNVNTLAQEIDFLKTLYMAVRAHLL